MGDCAVENGRIVLLNGASSAGKTSIARALQNRLGEPYLYVSLDMFLQMLPGRYFSVNPLATKDSEQGFTWQTHEDEQGTYFQVIPGAFGNRLMLEVMHHTIAESAAQGFNLIVDDLLLERSWLLDYLRVLRDFEVWFVQVYCPPDVLEARERARGDRSVGQARGQAMQVHQHGIYDLTVDTSLLSSEEGAAQIIAALEHKPTAFDQLRASLIG